MCGRWIRGVCGRGLLRRGAVCDPRQTAKHTIKRGLRRHRRPLCEHIKGLRPLSIPTYNIPQSPCPRKDKGWRKCHTAEAQVGLTFAALWRMAADGLYRRGSKKNSVTVHGASRVSCVSMGSAIALVAASSTGWDESSYCI